MTILLVLPIVVPLATAALELLASGRRRLQRWLNVAGSTALLTGAVALLRSVSVDGIQAVQIGGWPAPFGITLVADLFAAIMVVLAGIIGLAVSVYSLAAIDEAREWFGYYPLLQILLMGVCGAFLTGDIFNLYVWFEVMLMASFVLLVLGGERPQLEGGIKYVTLNLVASGFFLSGVGLLYGMTGTLNLADLAVRVPALGSPSLATAVSMLLLVAFGIKAAIFPLFFWLPASYHTPPTAVSAVFAGLLTKVGVYALIRVFTLVFVQDVAYTHNTLILAISGLTMVTGVLGAVAQEEFRRILSFHIVSQIGYMTMGLGLFTPYALAGSLFYVMHHIIVKTNLFLVSGIVQRRAGTGQLKDLGGVYGTDVVLAALFLVPALSLAGIPPLSGFVAKLALARAGFAIEQYAIVAVALGVGMLTLFSMTKIWLEVFWKAAPAGRPGAATEAESPLSRVQLIAPVVALALITIVIGVAADPAFALAQRAADQLLDPGAYIRAVLGPRS